MESDLWAERVPRIGSLNTSPSRGCCFPVVQGWYRVGVGGPLLPFSLPYWMSVFFEGPSRVVNPLERGALSLVCGCSRLISMYSVMIHIRNAANCNDKNFQVALRFKIWIVLRCYFEHDLCIENMPSEVQCRWGRWHRWRDTWSPWAWSLCWRRMVLLFLVCLQLLLEYKRQ